MTTEPPAGRELPELPEPVEMGSDIDSVMRRIQRHGYTADQMHAMYHQGREDERQAHGWRAIETAPHCQDVMVWSKGWGHDTGFKNEFGEWVCGDLRATGPTHWMPLPAAPTGGSET